ncbi:hypothetical protein A374_18104 [Fictibacillus macauensis ZFHKF-1]|uniref:Glycosyltransferase n=1 Tax=Fictibacillus macauensis ZFHKF-1 TaxID=1196324 RepID=I8AF60_9BACL|nr:hypothetical protein [Fictibacillus macauensis]EIT83974.1 hypothetical protein A374_18104 [Fictibacillus macauensis ZFHKF-1]
MEKILIITNADMSLQSGNVVLITRRAQEMYNQYNIETTCVIVKRRYEQQINHSIKGIEFVVNEDSTFIQKFILDNKPIKVIFYGIGAYSYINIVKMTLGEMKIKSKLLLDVQGALEEGIEYSNPRNYFKNYIKYLVKKRIFKRSLEKTDGAFVVSDEMEQYCKKISNKNDFITYKIRCGINEVLTTEERINWRVETRRILGVNDNTVVFAFSGYRMPWQKIDEIIKLFKEYDSKYDNVFFAFFCNVDEPFLELVKQSFPKENFIVKFLNFDEYFKYLCACDVGFLLRDYNTTNKVAFPNKFSDYLNAGLILAIHNSIPEPFRILKENNVEFLDVEKPELNLKNILNRQNDIVNFYKKIEKICNNELMYSSQISKLKLIEVDERKEGHC